MNDSFRQTESKTRGNVPSVPGFPNCSSPTTRTVYIFSGSRVLAEYDNGAAPGSPSREYIYSGSTQIAKIVGTTVTYFHQDHLSNRLVTSSSGTVVEQLGHLPFGETWYDTGSEKLKFTSYERDSETGNGTGTGNDYALARYDVNRLGRFSSPDPLSGSTANPQSLNRYAYVGNDPINAIDPTGADMIEWGTYNGNCVDAHVFDPICGPNDPAFGPSGPGDDGFGFASGSVGDNYGFATNPNDPWAGDPPDPTNPSDLKAALNALFANKPDCAELLGGSSNAGRLVAAMTMAAVPAPYVFRNSSQQEAYGAVASGDHPAATAWTTNCSTCKGWDGNSFVTYYGDQFSSYGQSLQLTILIHELGHPYTGYGQPMDDSGIYSYENISRLCGTASTTSEE